MLTRRLDQAGLKGDLDLAARFEELACTVADALDAASPRGPAAPYWLDLDREAYAAQLAELRRWVDTGCWTISGEPTPGRRGPCMLLATFCKNSAKPALRASWQEALAIFEELGDPQACEPRAHLRALGHTKCRLPVRLDDLEFR
jgi:hypothetical protein